MIVYITQMPNATAPAVSSNEMSSATPANAAHPHSGVGLNRADKRDYVSSSMPGASSYVGSQRDRARRADGVRATRRYDLDMSNPPW